jgi:hypothetical protein
MNGGIVIMGVIIGENEKRKARRARLFQRKNGMEKNQIVQTMNQQRKKSIIIITIVR